MLATIENEFLKLSVKGSGAEVVSVRDSDNVEYIWQGEPEFWPRRAPVLFPIVGKLNDHTYKFDGKEYVLPQHGFARNQMFNLVEGTKNKLVFLLKETEETLPLYPFHFELYIGYELKDKKVIVTYEVINTDNRNIYFSIGGHPGFNVALFPDEQFSDYYLEFSENETASRHLLSDGVFTGEQEDVLKDTNILNLSYELFKKDALVFKSLKSNSVILKSKKSDYSLKFDFSDFRYLGIWTPPKKANFVCIEPWLGIADYQGFNGEFKDKEGVQSLEPGKSFKCSFSFEILSVKPN